MDSLNPTSPDENTGTQNEPAAKPGSSGNGALANPGSGQARRFRFALAVLGIAAMIYLCILFTLLWNETSLVYPGADFRKGNWNPAFEFEEVEFKSRDGTPLVGWFLPRDNAQYNILLCHGNAENVAESSANVGDFLRHHLNANVFVFDYRGYGKSGGRPDEPGVLDDSEAALRWLNQRTDTTPGSVILVGHSLGGGPAVHLAAQFGAKALVLQRTFSSLVGTAQDIYWWLPVSYLMQNQYRSDQKILVCHDVPLFQSHGSEDGVVSIDSARNLFECCPCEFKQFYEVSGMNHYQRLPEEYWEVLKVFVDSVDASAANNR